MARKFEFKKEVQSSAHLRQQGVCALCGNSLAWDFDPAHPVVPIVSHQRGAGSDWREEVDNCVILCNGCYIWTSDDSDTPAGSPTDADEFVFSHGPTKRSGAHQEWAIRMMGRQ